PDDGRRDGDGRVPYQLDDGRAEDVEIRRERRRREGRDAGLVGAEVAGEAVRRVARSPREAAARADRRAMAEGLDGAGGARARIQRRTSAVACGLQPPD